MVLEHQGMAALSNIKAGLAVVPEVPLHSHFALSPQDIKGPFGHLREHVSCDRIVGWLSGAGVPWEPPAPGPPPRSRNRGATWLLEAWLVVSV